MADLLFIMLLISGCNCGKKFLTDKYLIELSDGPAPITARRSAMMRQMGRNLKRHQTGQSKRGNDEGDPMLDKLKRVLNRQIDAMTEQEVIDMLSGVENIEHITPKPENITSKETEPVITNKQTNNDSSKNVGGSIVKNATTKKDEQLCKGVKVMSECNARCMNGIFLCRGSDLVDKVHLQQDDFFSSVKLNPTTFSTAWSVPDAKDGDRCSVTCPGENNSTFSVKCEKSILDKKAAPPHWKGLGRVSRECKVLQGQDKEKFFRSGP